MARWIERAAAERALKPVLERAGIGGGACMWASRWLRVARKDGELVVVTFEKFAGEGEDTALARMRGALGHALGLADEPVPIDI